MAVPDDARPPDRAPELEGARVLVTGGDGFVGRQLLARLVREAADVHVISRRAGHPLRRHGEHAFHRHRGDLADGGFVSEAVARARPDVVLHLGAHVDGAPGRELVLPTLRANVLGTVHVLEAAAEARVDRVVLTGTMMEPPLEGSAEKPGSPYAMSKWAAAQYAHLYGSLYGLPVVHLRLFMTYGPGIRNPRKLLAHVALAALRDEPARVSSGRWSTDWIYVDDVVDAIVRAAVAPAAAAVSVDVGTGVATSLGDVVHRFAAKMSPRARVEFGARDDRPLEFPRVADETTWGRIGWKPATAMDAGLERTATWFRRHFTAEGPGRGEQTAATAARSMEKS